MNFTLLHKEIINKRSFNQDSLLIGSLLIDALPSEIYYDAKIKRFRYKGGSPGSPIRGTFLSRKEALALQRVYLNGVIKEFVSLAPSIIKGDIGTYTRAGELLKRIHVSYAILEAGGIDRLNQSQLGAIGNVLKKHYYQGKDDETGKPYGLKHLFKEVQSTPDYSEALLKNRLVMYANAGELSGHTVGQSIALDEGKTLVKRVLGATHQHCQDCLRYASLGYQPIGSLPLPKTRCQCRANCVCSMVFQVILPFAFCLMPALLQLPIYS